MATIGEGLANYGRNFAQGRQQQASLEQNRLLREQQMEFQNAQLKMTQDFNKARIESMRLNDLETIRRNEQQEKKGNALRDAISRVEDQTKPGPATTSLEALKDSELEGLPLRSFMPELAADTEVSKNLDRFFDAPTSSVSRKFTETQTPLEIPESVKGDIEVPKERLRTQQTEFGRDTREVLQGLLRPGFSSSPTSKLASDVDGSAIKLEKFLDKDAGKRRSIKRDNFSRQKTEKGYRSSYSRCPR